MKSFERTQQIAQSGLLDYLWQREQSIVNQLVSAHRAGKLDDRNAAIGVAVISEVRNMQKDLETALVKAVAEVDQLANPKESK